MPSEIIDADGNQDDVNGGNWDAIDAAASAGRISSSEHYLAWSMDVQLDRLGGAIVIGRRRTERQLRTPRLTRISDDNRYVRKPGERRSAAFKAPPEVVLAKDFRQTPLRRRGQAEDRESRHA